MDEKEYCFTGYCRQIDQSRMVVVEIFNGETEADCCWPDCPHAPQCTIAQQIRPLDPTADQNGAPG